MSADQKFEKLTNEMFTQFYRVYPEVASLMGLHDPYDNQLSKGDLSLYSDLENIIEEFVQQVANTIDLSTLSPEGQVEFEFVKQNLELFRFLIREQRQNVLNPDVLGLVFGMTFFSMIARDYAPLEQRMEAVANRIKEIPRYLKEFRTRFEKSQPVKLWKEIALENLQFLPGLFQLFTMIGKGQISDSLQEKLEKAVAALEIPLKEHTAWLQKLHTNPDEDWALGKDRFEKLLQLRKLEMTSEEILQFGYQSLKSLKEEAAKIAAEIDPDKTIDEIQEIIRNNKPANFEEAILATQNAVEQAKQFIIENDIATVYEQDKLIVKETPPYLRFAYPLAALLAPARYDKPWVGFYLMTRPQDEAELGKTLWNHPTIPNTAVHEAIPGHFLQICASLRGSLVIILQGLTTLGTETTEGWAHYCEQMMREKGFLKGPDLRFAQINAAIFRAVRIILDVKMSRGEMTVDEAVNLLIQETGIAKDTAKAEVRRYPLFPGYPLSYLLGKHLILQLREEIKAKMGTHYSDKFFHDTITSYGYMPVSLLRKIFNHRIAHYKS